MKNLQYHNCKISGLGPKSITSILECYEYENDLYVGIDPINGYEFWVRYCPICGLDSIESKMD